MLNFSPTRSLEPKENLKVIISIDFRNYYSIIDVLNIPGNIIDFLKEEYFNLDSQEIFDWNNKFNPDEAKPGTFHEVEFYISCEPGPWEYPEETECIATVLNVNQVQSFKDIKGWYYFGMDLGVEEHD